MSMTVDAPGMGGIGLVALLAFALWLAFVVLLLVLVILAIRWLIRQLNSSSRHDPETTLEAQDTSLAILRERFARGEIDGDEYEQRRRTLGG
jgi:putative membrane protein